MRRTHPQNSEFFPQIFGELECPPPAIQEPVKKSRNMKRSDNTHPILLLVTINLSAFEASDTYRFWPSSACFTFLASSLTDRLKSTLSTFYLSAVSSQGVWIPVDFPPVDQDKMEAFLRHSKVQIFIISIFFQFDALSGRYVFR